MYPKEKRVLIRETKQGIHPNKTWQRFRDKMEENGRRMKTGQTEEKMRELASWCGKGSHKRVIPWLWTGANWAGRQSAQITTADSIRLK